MKIKDSEFCSLNFSYNSNCRPSCTNAPQSQLMFFKLLCENFRSSRLECSVKKILRNFTKFTKNTCARVFLLKKRLWHRCFPVNFVKFCKKTTFLHRTPLMAASEIFILVFYSCSQLNESP